MSAPARVAVVTGASTGIGRATALLLARDGWRVFATVRTSEAEGSLLREAAGLALSVLRLDVADEDAVRRTIAEVRSRAGRIDALVNNAGYALVGAVEDLSRDRVRHQFETNVFGAVHLCREVLPIMRAQAGGTIVNVSSLAGRVSVPLMGAYCASKFALEAFSDALRGEARPFGVRVVLVEPGPVVTRFQRNALEQSLPVLAGPSAYAGVYEDYRAHFETDVGATPEQVARTIRRALRASRPRSRYRVRMREGLLAGVIQVVPRGAMDWALVRYTGLRALRREAPPPGVTSR